MKQRRISQDVVNEILRMYVDERIGAPTIADTLGINPKTVASVVHEYGVARHSLHKLTREQEDEVIAMYEGGMTIYEIGDRFGMNGGSIARLLGRHGIERRPGAFHPKYSEDEVNNILEMYASGMTGKQIQDETGVAPGVTSYFLTRNGLSGRTASDYRTYTIDETAFDDMGREEAAYWYGFIYADGHVAKGQGLQIALNYQDYAHLEKFQDFIQTNAPIEYIDNGTKHGAAKIVVWSNYVAARLTQLGIVARRTRIFDPNVLPPESYRHFARGFMDGDGSVDYRVPRHKKTAVLRVRFCGNQSTLEWLKDAINAQTGIFSNASIYPRMGIMGLDYGSSLISKAILDWMYADASVYLDRKYLRYTNYLEYRGW